MDRQTEERLKRDRTILGLCHQQAKAKGWCEACGGTGFQTFWAKIEDPEDFKNFYGDTPQEFSYTCPICKGTGGRKKENSKEEGLSRNRPTTSTWDLREREKTKCYIKRSMIEWSGTSEYPLGASEDIVQRFLSQGR